MFTNGHDIEFVLFLVILFAGGSLLLYLLHWITRPTKKRKVDRLVTQVAEKVSIPKTEPVSVPEKEREPSAFLREIAVPDDLPIDPAGPYQESVYRTMPITDTKTVESPIIELKGLRKVYPARGRGKGIVEAVRGITFSVGAGEIFGLLGPNGAGKTTTMRMLCTLLVPTSGSASIAGHDLVREQIAIRRQIGYVSQVGGMQRETTGRENLMLQAKLYGMSLEESKARVDELIHLFQLQEFADRKTVTYSGGQRRIFDLASGIVHRPQILFLDEPSTGLDPQNRAHVWEQVKKLREQGTTIFVTTHYLEEADELCDRVAIVDHGTVVAIGSPEELKQQIAGDVAMLEVSDSATATQVVQLFAGVPFVREANASYETVHLYIEKGDENLPEIMRMLHERGVSIRKMQLSRPSLDDVFLKLTGRSFQSEN